MGRTNFSRVGYGMTESEARRDAIESADRESGTQDGYSGDMNSACDGDMKSKCIKQPKPAKRCTVENNVQKGTRKWITAYIIEDYWGMNSDVYEVVKGSQGNAITRAKELALKHNKKMRVSITKMLDNGDNKIATVNPKSSSMGAWRFSGTARC